MDLSQATTVRKSSVQTQDFDLRYKYSNGKFQLSDRFYSNKNMNMNGLTFHLIEHEGETVLLVSIRLNEESVFYKGKAGDADKATDFAYSVLENSLKDFNMIDTESSDRFENFTLNPVGENEGYSYFQIVPRGEGSDEIADEPSEEVEAKTDLTGELVDDSSQEDKAEEATAEAETEDAVAEGEYDPFS